MITDDFFTQGINLHSWDLLAVSLPAPIDKGRDMLKKELQQETWEALRTREFDDLIEPSKIYIGLLLSACVLAIRRSVGVKSLDVQARNMGEDSSLTVNDRPVYSLHDFNCIVREQSRYDDFHEIIGLIYNSTESFTKTCKLITELSEMPVGEVVIKNRLSEADLGGLGLNNLPISTLHPMVANAISAACMIGEFVKNHAKDAYQCHRAYIQNEGIAISLSLVGENGDKIAINTYEDLLSVVKTRSLIADNAMEGPTTQNMPAGDDDDFPHLRNVVLQTATINLRKGVQHSFICFNIECESKHELVIEDGDYYKVIRKDYTRFGVNTSTPPLALIEPKVEISYVDDGDGNKDAVLTFSRFVPDFDIVYEDTSLWPASWADYAFFYDSNFYDDLSAEMKKHERFADYAVDSNGSLIPRDEQ